MRAIFGVVGLLVVLAIVGMLARKQLGTAAPSAPALPGGQAEAPAPAPRGQVRQFERAVQDAMQQPRGMPAEEQ